MQLKWNMDIDEQVYIGDSDMGITGLLNLSQVTPISAAKAWATASPDEIVQDFNLILSQAWVTSGYAICPKSRPGAGVIRPAGKQEGF